MSGSSLRSVLALATLILLGASACSKKTVQAPISDPKLQTARVEPDRPTPPAETAGRVELADIFFEYDQSWLREDALSSLNANSKALQADPSLRLALEGHCDERGTVEYNLALGDRRARAAKDYLMRSGIDASRLTPVSYGEERPFAKGQGESAWSQNRRVHFARNGQSGI